MWRRALSMVAHALLGRSLQGRFHRRLTGTVRVTDIALGLRLPEALNPTVIGQQALSSGAARSNLAVVGVTHGLLKRSNLGRLCVELPGLLPHYDGAEGCRRSLKTSQYRSLENQPS